MILSLIPQQIVAFGERTLEARKSSLWITSRSKRCMDVVVSVMVACFTAPVLLAAVAAVRVSSGRVFTRESKAGQGGKTFSQYTLNVHGLSPRLLGLRLFLLRWGIDRLPQIWNVLRGDMSLVGPEAAAPGDMERFRYEIPHYGARNFAKPGLTGVAQQAGWGGRRDIRKRSAMDARYVNQSSFAGDISVLKAALLPKRAKR